MSKEEQLYLAAIIKAKRDQKLNELGHIVRGTQPNPERVHIYIYKTNTTKGAGRLGSYPTYEKHYRVFTKKQGKLRELAKMIRNE
jgi:hypothetical protein